VDDISTALLMKHFYRRYIKDNMSPTQALCLAQRWLFKKVDRPTVIREINSLSSKLESQRAQVPRWSDAAQSIDRQLSFLQKRLDALIREEALDPGGKPFAHPYYWAAFMISGADTENRR